METQVTMSIFTWLFLIITIIISGGTIIFLTAKICNLNHKIMLYKEAQELNDEIRKINQRIIEIYEKNVTSVRDTGKSIQGTHNAKKEN